jgi:hypothetical protein
MAALKQAVRRRDAELHRLGSMVVCECESFADSAVADAATTTVQQVIRPLSQQVDFLSEQSPR